MEDNGVSVVEGPQEATGTCALPLARVKKILRADLDTGDCSNNAAFAITVATELFVQHLMEQTHTMIRAEGQRGKVRRNVQYKDIASAVSKHDNLEFLTDVVPNTMLLKDYSRALQQGRFTEPVRVPKGQNILSFTTNSVSRTSNDRLSNDDGSIPGSARPPVHNFDAVRSTTYDPAMEQRMPGSGS